MGGLSDRKDQLALTVRVKKADTATAGIINRDQKQESAVWSEPRFAYLTLSGLIVTVAPGQAKLYQSCSIDQVLLVWRASSHSESDSSTS